MGWMANTDINTDIQPPTSLHAVLSSVGKYVSKPEESSVSYTELQAQILPCINDRTPLLSFVSRMLNIRYDPHLHRLRCNGHVSNLAADTFLFNTADEALAAYNNPGILEAAIPSEKELDAWRKMTTWKAS
jgi:hypothetical protein